MLPVNAFHFLLAEGYFATNEAGWARAVKPPKKGDLVYYVACLKALGAWSTGDSPRVEVSRGDRPEEVLFRLKGNPS